MCEVQPRQVDIALVVACHDGNIDEVKRLVEEKDADICYQDFRTGMSVLMVAAGAGHTDIVNYLLSEGAPWNAVDRSYLCAGDYAAKNKQQDCIDALINHAVMCEFLLSMAESSSDSGELLENVDSMSFATATKVSVKNSSQPLNASYLASRLEYSDDGKSLIDTNTHLAVMMDWETPIMEQHAAWICHADMKNSTVNLPIRVLNVGFGMGIVDTIIQKYSPDSHFIIEAHSEVLEKMKSEGWFTKPGVRILPNKWQDAVVLLAKDISEGVLPRFTGIFFDTYAEDDNDLREFHTWLPKLLVVPNQQNLGDEFYLGRYSYYNGLCPDNVFFHGVACETMRLHLKRLAINCVFDAVAVDVTDPKLWKDVSQRYWHFDTYYLPKCTFDPDKKDK
ncbi:Protein arginine N-methyltransferase 2 isoform 1 [Schistosoma japonicum]|uniref:Protein arginine N-methyltransferase 2 isoform 1 n=3 Tax=Schistosoma japonicum TaxID=6182 RepID=A0A4Z2DUK3_SCHJA|nr:Protein arginine N-methyltransferase 2 isoform 1 [Schistosoma japonicum]